MNPRSLKAVFFDLDDTLFPSEETYQVGLRLSWRVLRTSHRLSWARFQTLYAKARENVKGRLGVSPSARNRVLYLKRLVELLEGHTDATLTLRLIAAYDRSWKQAKTMRLDWLHSLSKRYTLGIVTNQVGLMQLQKLERIDPHGRLFNFMVTSEEVGVEKPHPAIFREACRVAGCKPREALMVGDSWKADVRGALKAGLQAAHLTSSPAASHPRVISLRSLRDLPGFLRRGRK